MIVNPEPAVISLWYDGASQAVGGRPFAVTETGQPAAPPFGSEEYQTSFARNLIDYLLATPADIEFVSWWSIEDSDSHPDIFFQSLGLMTSAGPDGIKRPAFYLWAGASN